MGIAGVQQQVYTTGNVTPSDSTVYTPPIIAVWVTTGGTMVVRGRGDNAVSGSITVATGLLTFPYPVDKIMATGTSAVFGVGVQAGS